MNKFEKSVYNQLYNLNRTETNKDKKERRNSRRSRSHRLDVVLKEQQPLPIHKSLTICFAANRTEVGACATFQYRYEALAFVELLTKSGYWVQIQEEKP